MSTREMCYQVLGTVPEFKLGYALTFLQGLAAGTDKEDTPNMQTMAALEEAEDMVNHPDQYKRYDTFSDLLNEVLEDA